MIEVESFFVILNEKHPGKDDNFKTFEVVNILPQISITFITFNAVLLLLQMSVMSERADCVFVSSLGKGDNLHQQGLNFFKSLSRHFFLKEFPHAFA